MTSKRYLKIDQKYVDKADPLPGGALGLMFNRFFMILGSISECIFDSMYAWYAVFSFACLQLDSGKIAVGFSFCWIILMKGMPRVCCVFISISNRI